MLTGNLPILIWEKPESQMQNNGQPRHPHLYELYITLMDNQDNVLAVIPQKVGFRRVEISGGRIRVNRQAIRLKGVNRHEHNQTHCPLCDP